MTFINGQAHRWLGKCWVNCRYPLEKYLFLPKSSFENTLVIFHKQFRNWYFIKFRNQMNPKNIQISLINNAQCDSYDSLLFSVSSAFNLLSGKPCLEVLQIWTTYGSGSWLRYQNLSQCILFEVHLSKGMSNSSDIPQTTSSFCSECLNSRIDWILVSHEVGTLF